MAIVFEDLGVPLTHQKIVPGNSSTAIGSEFIIYTERLLPYTSGGTTQIVVGDWIVGATSAAKAEVVAVSLTSGTWGGGTAAGTFRIRSQHGTFQSENVLVAAGTNDATIAANSTVDPGGYTYKGMTAKAALVSVYAQTALVDVTGGKPDQTALTGQPMAAGSSWILRNRDQIKQLKVIDYTAGSASTVQVTLFY
jgi:hypothetical protein